MNATPFAELSPDFVLDAVEAIGFAPDGRLQALNSFENRVYQVGIEGGEPLIAKFYRPGRWNDAAIREEHAYAHELVEAELPVVLDASVPDQCVRVAAAHAATAGLGAMFGELKLEKLSVQKVA